MNNLCIDFGSTFIKFFVLDKNEIVFRDKIDFPKPCVNDGVRYEVNIEEINRAIFEIFEKAEGFSVEKCFFAVQMHGYILKDKNGSFSNYVSWKDKRGDISNEKLSGIDFNKNGTSLKCNLPAVKLVEEKRECLEFFTLGSYITWVLTGQNTTHKTDACASGFFNAKTLKPIDFYDNLIFPKVTHGIFAVGKYKGIEIYTGVGDHQLSFLGSEAGDTAYLLNIGTATQISTLGEEKTGENGTEQRPFFDNQKLFTVSGLTGGETLFSGYDKESFCKEVLAAIEKLPRKSKILVGGGGADIVFNEIENYFKKRGISCVKLKKNISEEGLKELANMCKIKNGTMLSEVCFANFPIILKNANLDFLIVDNEHGAFDYSFLSGLVMNSRLIDLPVIVRLPDNNRKDITKLVDMGVTGFLLPMTNSAEDIKKVVDFAKYSPIGKRGISTNRAHTFYNPPPIDEYMKTANEKVKVYAQIETAEGVRNIKEILSLDGVDGVFVGPNDLSCDLGCIGNNGPVKEAISEISNAAREQNKPWGIITTSKDLIDFSLESNVGLISYGSEINMLKDACKNLRGNIYG